MELNCELHLQFLLGVIGKFQTGFFLFLFGFPRPGRSVVFSCQEVCNEPFQGTRFTYKVFLSIG